jgi:hypothetical protein
MHEKRETEKEDGSVELPLPTNTSLCQRRRVSFPVLVTKITPKQTNGLLLHDHYN